MSICCLVGAGGRGGDGARISEIVIQLQPLAGGGDRLPCSCWVPPHMCIPLGVDAQSASLRVGGPVDSGSDGLLHVVRHDGICPHRQGGCLVTFLA